MADEIFRDRRLAELYDPLDPDRGDLDAYLRLAEESGARRVLDIGCFPTLRDPDAVRRFTEDLHDRLYDRLYDRTDDRPD
jgi:hypothetical protein